MQHDDRHDGPARKQAPTEEDTRRWGYDPDNDRDTRDDRDARGASRPPVQAGDGALDAPHDPGRDAHLAAGSGGDGDWEASAAGIGQRRGPIDDDRPFELRRPPGDAPVGERHLADDRSRGPDGAPSSPPHVAQGTSYAGWSSAGSAQAGWSEAPPLDAPTAPTAHRDVGPSASAGMSAPPDPQGAPMADDGIHDDIRQRLASEPDLDTGDVAVTVHGGRVTLAGTVVDRPTKHAIESLVDRCPGVREIDNRIKVMRGGLRPDPDAPPTPRPSVPGDSPTARDEALGRHSEPTSDRSGYYG